MTGFAREAQAFSGTLGAMSERMDTLETETRESTRDAAPFAYAGMPTMVPGGPGLDDCASRKARHRRGSHSIFAIS